MGRHRILAARTTPRLAVVCLALLFALPAAADPARRLSRGWTFTEGPLLLEDGTLFFVDAWASRILVQPPPGGPVLDVPADTNKPAGLAWSADGRLLVTEFGGGRVSAVDPITGDLEVLADSYEGRPLNSPNDLVVDSDGGIYFTDPAFLVLPRQGDQGVYYISPDGDITKAAGEFRTPNGIALSNDGRYLVVAEFFANRLTRFRVEAPGVLTDRTVIARTPTPDGMCVDDHDRLFVAAGGNIHWFDFDGNHLGKVKVRGDTTNCAIGGIRMVITAKRRVFEMRVPQVED